MLSSLPLLHLPSRLTSFRLPTKMLRETPSAREMRRHVTAHTFSDRVVRSLPAGYCVLLQARRTLAAHAGFCLTARILFRMTTNLRREQRTAQLVNVCL